MSSLADLPELVGFFSYSRSDDEHSGGALSRLRARIQSELRLQLGRRFRLWQDTAAIPDGSLWEDEIKRAIAESVFFIPIVTPSTVGSQHCRFEFDSFLKREAELGRSNLIFPLLYVGVPALESEQLWRQDDLLKIIGSRQYTDWQKFRHRDVASAEVAEKIENFCSNISKALRQPWVSPEEHRLKEQAEIRQKAEEEERRKKVESEARERAERERLVKEAEVKRRAEEKSKKAEADTQRRAEDERRNKLESEARRMAQGPEARRRRAEVEAQIKAEEEERRQGSSSGRRGATVAATGIALLLIGWIGLYQIGVPIWVPWGPVQPDAAIEARRKADQEAAAKKQTEDEAKAARKAEEERKRAAEEATRKQEAAMILSPERERALKPKDTFKECPTCPEMIVVPPGSFSMGSAQNLFSFSDESPRHTVTFARQFAAGRFAVTMEEWDACAADGGCRHSKPSDQGWGRGRRPVINVDWEDAQQYVAWLSKKTNRTYRLLSEAEREYGTRGGTTTAYSWGDDIGKGNANCDGCGSQWDNKQTAPVGSFAANAFGLYDSHGNVWEFVQDCYNISYNGAPTDGSAWTVGDCSRHVVRGGSWFSNPQTLRSAKRADSSWGRDTGFRVGTTFNP
jgi:formylglycine-generating enzyme required for sulfatase activity